MNPYISLALGFVAVLVVNRWLAKGGARKIKARLDAADQARVEERKQRWREASPEVSVE